ncbi:hypothetical protein KUTeg_015831 [Tegillarca granosa]|uniref:Elongation of very long chain fatty acids protein n=1 Tax=Tegillarca granosa TaxID=220873 RepID=A0ABQ9EJ56_TEGGR|nr:hypothetical protein KUTeg_015831 [Tegillarca granosa]
MRNNTGSVTPDWQVLAGIKMAEFITKAQKMYDDMMSKADPRVDGWFMMSTPWPSLIICVAYIIFVLMGPKLMANRKPFEIKNILFVYNLAMIGLSTYCFVEVFFIMRKKFNQVSFLHVFHHGIMPVSWWFGVKFVPGGFGTFHSLLNSFIHLVMYTYYFLAGLGPAYQKYLWWKKYMTSMQITQFILVTIHSVQLLIIDCAYPKLFVYWIGLYAVVFLVMFVNFYIQAYRKPKTHKAGNGAVQNGIKEKKN